MKVAKQKQHNKYEVQESNKIYIVFYSVLALLFVSLCLIAFTAKRLTNDTIYFLVDTFYYTPEDIANSANNTSVKTPTVTIDNGDEVIKVDAPDLKTKEDADAFVKSLIEKEGMDSSQVVEKP